MQLTVQTREKKEPMGDLFGIFFEDINYAADGGLYGEKGSCQSKKSALSCLKRKRSRQQNGCAKHWIQ